MSNSNLTAALDQINEIHSHMARSQVYRGYRPVPVAVSGAVGLLAAWMQPIILANNSAITAGDSMAENNGDPLLFVIYWLTVAGICALLAASAVFVHFMQQSAFERRQILYVWGQFVPCLAAGGIVGAGIAKALPEAVPMLPGIWAIVFSLGIFSSRPFLPRITGWVALYYLVAGAWLLLHPTNLAESAWQLAIVFFVGQCAGALILYLKLERTPIDVETFEE